MTSRFRVFILGLLILIVLAGCTPASSQPAALPTLATTPIPGWKEFQGAGVGLWAPDTFEGGSLSGSDRQVLIDKIKALGKDFESSAQLIENNPNAFLFFAVDSKINSSGGTNIINITTEKVLSAMTIDSYLDAATKQFPAQMSIDSRALVTLDGRIAGKMVIEISSLGVKEALYVFKDGNNIYGVTYSTSASDFDHLAPDFELSAKTFYVKS